MSAQVVRFTLKNVPDLRRRNCMVCRRPDTEVGPISWRGKCRPCGHARSMASMVDLHNHEGPMFDRWREQMAACVGGVLLDDVQRET